MLSKNGVADKPKRNDGQALNRAIERWKANAAGPEYVARANKVRSAIGKVSKSKLLEMFEEMETKYPSRGWHENAMDLSKHWYGPKKFDADEYFQRVYGISPDEKRAINDLVDSPPF